MAGLVLMVAWMGLVKGAMLLWQGAIWLVNTALLANPVAWITQMAVLTGAALPGVLAWLLCALLAAPLLVWVMKPFSASSPW